jgi:hypothetical protein
MTLADQRPRLLLVSSFGERRGIPRNECTKTSFIAEGGQTESKGSVMRNRIVGIDPQDNQAIRREIGERLRARHRAQPELPTSLKEKFDELRRLEGQWFSILPEVGPDFEDKLSCEVSGQDIEYFKILLRTEIDEKKRRVLERLLGEKN